MSRQSAAKVLSPEQRAATGAPVVRACLQLVKQGWGNDQASALLAHGAATMAVAGKLPREEWLSLCGQLFDKASHTDKVQQASEAMGLQLCNGGRA